MFLQFKRKIYIRTSTDAIVFAKILDIETVDYERGYDKRKGWYFVVGKQRR